LIPRGVGHDQSYAPIRARRWHKRRARSPAANLGNVILQDRKGRFDCATGGMISARYISSGESPMANVVKKHSISFELAQKMVDKAVAKAREIGVSENVVILDDGGNLKAGAAINLRLDRPLGTGRLLATQLPLTIRSCSSYRPKTTSSATGSKAPTNHTSGWSRKASSSGRLTNGHPARAHRCFRS
jgi:hypothetical protein